MGGNCSAKISRDGGCGSLERIARCEEECDPCDSDAHADLTSEHPLLLRLQQEGGTPRTPRGPAPPWAVEKEERRDRTATGCTPPRSPTPVKTVPPGLPEEEAVESAMALAGSFGLDFIQELYRQARAGDAARMSVQLQKVHSAAFSLLSGSGLGFADGSSLGVAEHSDQAAELAKDFLDKVRDGQKATLLGAATAGGVPVVHMLLLHKAEPLVADARGQTPLHAAAEQGSLLTALMLLDRMQGHDRLTNLTELPNGDGETPEMQAAMAGKQELCSALEVFRQMQSDAQLRQLGAALAPDCSGRISTGDLMCFVDLSPEASEEVQAHSGVLLRHVAVGSPLVPNLFGRIPEDQEELSAMIERVCAGLHAAEDFLRRHHWDSSDPGLDPALKSFVATAELRGQWQRIRNEALISKGAASELEDFWQTHLSAEAMAGTIRNALGDTFQLLLTALWLYTREAWLRHLLDALAVAMQNMPLSARDGATGSAPEAPSLQPLVAALAPSMQLVQAALCWFEEANIHHTAATYRPLLLPMLGLQKLVDRYVAFRKAEESKEPLAGFWLSLGGGSFFSALSCRSLAIARLAKCRCNVLLIIRPDETKPSYPKHMSLRGSNVDDSLFPLDSLFRISRITRTVSCELDVDGTSGLFKGSGSRWPVIVIEVHSVSCYTEVMTTLHARGQLSACELMSKVEEWLQSSPPEREAERLHQAGLLFSQAARAPKASAIEQKKFGEKARQLLEEAARSALCAGHTDLAAQVLLSKVKQCTLGSKESDARQAVELLKNHFAEGRALTQNAKELAHELQLMGVTDLRLT